MDRRSHLVDARAAAHIPRHILSLVDAHARTLEQAGYPAVLFFDRRFTIDTGQIVNQSRAIALFRGLAATEERTSR